jgi:opacity protein-like surface antigen
MGAEVEANDGRASRNDTLNGVAVKTKQTYGGAVSTRMGYEFGNFMPYMRLGYGVNHFETDARVSA